MVKKITTDLFKICCYISMFIIAIILLYWVCNIKNPFISSFRESFTDNNGRTIVLKGTWDNDNKYWDNEKGDMVQIKDITSSNYTSFDIWIDPLEKCGVHVIKNGDITKNNYDYDDITVSITGENEEDLNNYTSFNEYIESGSSSFIVSYNVSDKEIFKRTVNIIEDVESDDYKNLKENNQIVKAHWEEMKLESVPSNMIDDVIIKNPVWDILLGESFIDPENTLTNDKGEQTIIYKHKFSDNNEIEETRIIKVGSEINSRFISNASDGDTRSRCENDIELDKVSIEYGCEPRSDGSIITPGQWFDENGRECNEKKVVNLYDKFNVNDFVLYPRNDDNNIDTTTSYSYSNLSNDPNLITGDIKIDVRDMNTGSIITSNTPFADVNDTSNPLTWSIPFTYDNTCSFNFSIVPKNIFTIPTTVNDVSTKAEE